MIYNFGKHEIDMFDSIHKMPILRFQRFNKYQMQASEIGSTFQDYDKRTLKILQFIQKDMKNEALMEMENRRQSVFNAYNEFSPDLKSFAVLIKRIDNKYYNTFSPDDLDRCLKHLNDIGFTHSDCIERKNESKKKIEMELQVYFGSYFPKNGNKEQSVLIFNRSNMILDNIIKGKKVDDGLFDIEKEILEHETPNIWNVHTQGNMEKTLEVDFRKFGIAVTEQTGQKIEEITTFTFYSSVEYLKEKYKKNKKG